MKAFISKNWKRIIFTICGFAIVVNLIKVTFTPATVIDDFYNYGPNYSQDIIDKTKNLDVDVDSDINTAAGKMSADTGIQKDYTKIIIVFTILICGALILSNIVDGGSAPAKKK